MRIVMEPLTFCIICEAVGGHAFNGKIAQQQAETALTDGWAVKVMAKRLDETFCNRVERLYSIPPLRQTLIYASPPEKFVSEEERAAARIRWLGHLRESIVANFLGGLVERKGYRRILKALEGEKNIFLLIGGSHSAGFHAPELGTNMLSIGECSNTDSFDAACHVMLVTSLFGPFEMVTLEASARGVPVIATEGDGALPHILEHSAGARWQFLERLAPMTRLLSVSESRFQKGCSRYH